jgi:hypothetical protein
MLKFSYDASGNVGAVSALLPPRITGHPVQQVAALGEIVTFSVAVSDASGVTFQWKFNGADIPGAIGDSLVLTNVSTADRGQYSVVVTNSEGSLTSVPAMLLLDGDGDTLPENTFLRSRLTAYSDAGGSVAVAPFKLSYDLGETVTLTATPIAPNGFTGWAGDLKMGDLPITTNPITFPMNGNKTIRAKFAVPVPLPSGLVACWRAENNAQDVIGASHGTMGDKVSFVLGKVGQAFAFNGDEVKASASQTLNIGAGNGLTIEAWIKPADLTHSYPIVEWKSESKFGAHFWINVLFESRGGAGCLYTNLIDTDQVFHVMISPAGLLSTDAWQHVALTYNRSSGFASLFVNGSTVASANLGRFTPLTTFDFHLGHRPGDTFYSGLMDEVSIYNRALTADEIFAIYNADFLGKDFTRPYFTLPSQLPDVVLGADYTQQLTTVFGTAPINFSLSSGMLPPGVTLSSSGVVDGVPNSSGIFDFTVRATDAARLFTEQLYTLQVFDSVGAPAGLVGWWRAEDDAKDSAGTNHGVLRNGTGFSAGKVGQAFSLDGTDDCVEIPDAPALRPVSLTLEAWVAFDVISRLIVIFAKPVGTGTSDSYALWLDAGTIRGAVGDAASNGTQLFAPFSPSLGSTYHLAYTFDDAAKQQALYVSGIQVAIGDTTKSIGYDTQPLLLGRDTENGIPNFFLQGRIDEASIYNRALSGAEIASVYNAGPAGKRLRVI